MGEHLTYWTIGLSLPLYLLTLVIRLRARRNGVLAPAARYPWTIAYVLLIIHVLCAFAYFHNWSQQEVYAFTARRTAEGVGLNWGAGLYVNYLFMAVWGLDVVWWWLVGTERYERRPRWIEWPIQLFLAFIVFNGTVVFARPVTQLMGWAGTIVLGIAIWDWQRHTHRRRFQRRSIS